MPAIEAAPQASTQSMLGRISIILPAHNEERTIGPVIEGCRAALPNVDEILVIDDGSTDATAKCGEDCDAKVIRLDTNRGKGNALRLGIERSCGEVLVFLDSDGQDDPQDLPRLLDSLASGADLVVGSRFLGHFEPGAITTLNRYGNLALTGIVNLLFGVRLTDTQAGFRVMRRGLLERLTLQAKRYDIETDLLLQAVKMGARVVEVPVHRRARARGVSGLNRVTDGLRILLRILRVRFLSSNVPKKEAEIQRG